MCKHSKFHVEATELGGDFLEADGEIRQESVTRIAK